MAAFEAIKMQLFPEIAIWESHLLTIFFASLIATLVARYVFRHLEMTNSQLREQVSKSHLLETELKTLNEGLEQQIDERTNLLLKKNEQLENEILHRSRIEKHLMLVNQDLDSLLYRNQVLMKTANDGIHIMDIEGRVIEANDAFCKFLGYTQEEIIGMNVSEWDATYSTDELKQRFKELIGKSAIIETVHRRKDGALLNVEISVTGVQIAGVPYLYASSRDITQRKISETALLQHKHVIETTTDGFWISDMQGMLLETNEAYAKMSGYSVDELRGMYISQLEAQEKSVDEVKTHIAKIIIQGSDLFETKHRHKAGHIIDIEVSTTFASESQQFYVFCRDISERKKVFRELKLRESYLSAIIENQDGMVWLKDKEGRYLAANHHYIEACGKSIQDILGKTDVDLWPREVAEKYRADDAIVMRTKKPLLVEESGCNNGVQCWYETYKSPVLNELGEIIATAGASHDITMRKQIENDLRISAVTFESHEAILITDFQANIVRVNQAFTDITGYRSDEVLGKNPRIMSSGRHDKQFYIEMWQQLLHLGTWSGEIWDKRKDGQIYPKWVNITAVKNEKDETTGYVAIFSDITARKKTEEEIHNLAFYDSLTKLPNRRLFLERFRAALPASARSNNFGAIFFIDMDRFKVLNDTMGHDYGDLMLIEVARRIKSCVREMDTVARLGGDEFVVLIKEISDDKNAASRKVGNVAEKIRVALSYPYEINGYEHHSSPSTGINLYHGNQIGIDELLKQADLAMYQAKNSGRNAVRFFDPVMQQNVSEHTSLSNDLHQALLHKELNLYFQMQVDSNHSPIGAEGLLRWEHPERGIVMPDQFIPIAEESALITDIDQWVIKRPANNLLNGVITARPKICYCL